jgi:hypothetical protein
MTENTQKNPNNLKSLKHGVINLEIMQVLKLLSLNHSDLIETLNKIPDDDERKDLKELWNSNQEEEIRTVLEQSELYQLKSHALNLLAKRIKFCTELQTNDQLWEKLIAAFPEGKIYLEKIRARLIAEGEYLANSPKTLLKQLKNLAVFEKLLLKVNLDESMRTQINTNLLHEKEMLEQAIVDRLKVIIETGDLEKNCPIQQTLEKLKEENLLNQKMDVDLGKRSFDLKTLYKCTLIFLDSKNIEDFVKKLLLHGCTVSELKNAQTVRCALKKMYGELLNMDPQEVEEFFAQPLSPKEEQEKTLGVLSKIISAWNTAGYFVQRELKAMDQSLAKVSSLFRSV